MTHSDRDHVCDDCRCDNVAGAATQGDFYGIGRPDLGHYGTGLCSSCEKSVRYATKEKLWREHLKALQTVGTPTSIREIEQNAVVEAQRAEENLEVRDAIDQVRAIIREMDDLENGVGLTEKGNGGPQPMSDATRIKLKMDRARLLNELGKTKFEISKELTIPIDVLNMWVRDTIILAQECCVTTDDYNKFVRKFKNMIMATRNQAMTRAAVQAGEDTMEKTVTSE